MERVVPEHLFGAGEFESRLRLALLLIGSRLLLFGFLL